MTSARCGAFYCFYFTEFPVRPLLCLDEDRDAVADIVSTLTGDEDTPIVEYYDQTSIDFEESLREIQTEEDDTEPDFLFVYILSHGDENANLMTMDGEMPLMDVLAMFSDEACPRFAGRPKIFLIQACRGHLAMPKVKSDPRSTYQGIDIGASDQEASSSGHQETAKEVDMNNELLRVRRSLGDNFFVAYATPPGRFTWYKEKEGSQFTRVLREAVSKHKDEGLMQLMVRTNRSMMEEQDMQELCYFVSRLHQDFPMHP